MILDLSTRSLTDDGKSVRLSKREMALIAALAAVYPNMVGRDDLVDRVWPGRYKPSAAHDALSHLTTSTRRKLVGGGIADVLVSDRVHGVGVSVPVKVVGTVRVEIDRDTLTRAAALLRTYGGLNAAVIADRLLAA